MTLKDLLKNNKDIIDVLSKYKDLLLYISNIAVLKGKYFEFYKDLYKSYNQNSNVTYQQITPVINDLKKFNKDILTKIREYKPPVFVTAVHSLKNELFKSSILTDYDRRLLGKEFEEIIDLHTDAYSERTFDDILNFINNCDRFQNELQKFEFGANYVTGKLIEEPEKLSDEQKIIDIEIISSVENLEKFSMFLFFIDKFYQDLCKVFEIHHEDFPLCIIKVESGSVWTKLFGHKHLIQLIKDFILGIGKYIRDLQTGVIKKEQFENKVLQADLVLELIKKAKKIGVNEDKKVLLEKTLGQAILNISKSLPQDTTEILLDDKKLLNLNSIEQKAIKGKSPLMLNEDNKNEKPSA